MGNTEFFLRLLDGLKQLHPTAQTHASVIEPVTNIIVGVLKTDVKAEFEFLFCMSGYKPAVCSRCKISTLRFLHTLFVTPMLPFARFLFVFILHAPWSCGSERSENDTEGLMQIHTARLVDDPVDRSSVRRDPADRADRCLDAERQGVCSFWFRRPSLLGWRPSPGIPLACFAWLGLPATLLCPVPGRLHRRHGRQRGRRYGYGQRTTTTTTLLPNVIKLMKDLEASRGQKFCVCVHPWTKGFPPPLFPRLSTNYFNQAGGGGISSCGLCQRSSTLDDQENVPAP